jgi:UDP-N-acetyl-D-mannosaminuronic acid dehydrogenase
MEKICVVGLGYIGLPTASLLATKGFSVLGVDVRPDVVATINRGQLHIHEPDLDVLVKSAVQSGNLKAAGEPRPADIFIIAVPTPLRDGTAPDVSYVEAATAAIAPHVAHGNLIVLESTSPVGTTERIAGWLKELRPDLIIPGGSGTTVPAGSSQVYLSHCPERVLPGRILRELVDNDRIIGGIDAASAERAQAFYRQFVSGEILATDSRTAELAKLTENAYRDVNIAFANELSFICDQVGVDVWRLIELANRHPRVNILRPGPGVGGHCIAVDPWFIIHSAPDRARLMRTARQVNDSKPGWVVSRVKEKADRYKAPVIACLGLAFKADIDDLRESPAVEIVEELARQNVGKMLVVEPYIRELPGCLNHFDSIQLVDLQSALGEADLVLLLVDHRPFVELDRSLLQEKVVIDTRGLWR